jgi:hypothetical protein
MSKPDPKSKMPIFDLVCKMVIVDYPDFFSIYPFKDDKDTSELANPEVEVFMAMVKTLVNSDARQETKFKLNGDDARLPDFIRHFQKKIHVGRRGEHPFVEDFPGGAEMKEKFANRVVKMQGVLSRQGKWKT